MDTWSGFAQIAAGNMAAVQCQAIVVGVLAAFAAFILDFLAHNVFHPEHMQLMVVSSVAAASTASLLLSAVMLLVVVLARSSGIDPDNVMSPIAGFLGDFCTLGLLALIADLVYVTHQDSPLPSLAIFICYLLLASACARVAYVNPSTSGVLKSSWKPIIVSMLISSSGGLILQLAIRRFRPLAPFAPVMNGAGGNLAAVQTSRLSTDLHSNGRPGAMPMCDLLEDVDESKRSLSMTEELVPLAPDGTFKALCCSNTRHAKVARVLICLAGPGGIFFVSIIVSMQSGTLALPTLAFAILYEAATLAQVSILLVFAHGLVGNLWRKGVDPDCAAIPYVTSVGDLVGTTCLACAFGILTLLGASPRGAAEIIAQE